MKREDGYYWVRGIDDPPFGGGRAMVAEWRDGAWGFAADDELRTERHFEVLSEKLEPPVELSPFGFDAMADMTAKQMAETYPVEVTGLTSEGGVYFAVSVRDDHDGGSVWYVDEDYIEEQSEAEELAAKTSLKRENRSARVMKVLSEVMTEFFEGRPRVRN